MKTRYFIIIELFIAICLILILRVHLVEGNEPHGEGSQTGGHKRGYGYLDGGKGVNPLFV